MDGGALQRGVPGDALGAAFLLWAPLVAWWFTDDAAVARHAVDCLRIVSVGFLFFAYGLVLTQAFNGAGDTWTPTWIKLACFWVWQIPLACHHLPARVVEDTPGMIGAGGR